MTLLVAERLVKRQPRGRGLALDRASLSVDPGEFVTIRSREPSGRSALMLLLAGVAPPDNGAVRFEGIDVFANRRTLVPASIAICWDRFPPASGVTMLDQIAVPMLVAGATRAEAQRRAREVLARVGAEDVCKVHPHDADPNALARAAIARAIVLSPRLVLTNDLSSSVDLIEGDAIIALLRSLTREERISAIVMGPQAVAGADRALEIRGGSLVGQIHPLPRDLAAEAGTVVPLRRAVP